MTQAIETKETNLLTGNLLGVGAMVLWASGFPIAEVLLESWSALTLTAARASLAGVFLLFLWMLTEGADAVFAARWSRGAWVGGIGFGIGTWLLLVGQQMTDPVTVAIFASTLPISATLLEIILDKRRLSRGFVLGLSASVVGGIVATGGGSVDIGLGALVTLLSVLLFSWSSRGAVREFPELSPLGRTTITMSGGIIVTLTLLGLSVLFGIAPVPRLPSGANELMLITYFALGSYALSQLFWIACVGNLGVALAAFHSNIAPFYVMLFMLSLGAGWSWPQVIGAAIVGFGVVLAQR